MRRGAGRSKVPVWLEEVNRTRRVSGFKVADDLLFAMPCPFTAVLRSDVRCTFPTRPRGNDRPRPSRRGWPELADEALQFFSGSEDKTLLQLETLLGHLDDRAADR